MKLVYELSEALKRDPERVALTQKLTLDESQPLLGLKGTHGLFASEEWWESIRKQRMPLSRLSGVVTRAFVAGQDRSPINNTVELELPDGSRGSAGIYSKNRDDIALFRKGAHVEVVSALDEMKQPLADGSPDFLEIVLEVAVSV